MEEHEASSEELLDEHYIIWCKLHKHPVVQQIRSAMWEIAIEEMNEQYPINSN